MNKTSFVVVVGLLSAVFAFADGDHAGPCKEDVQKLCKDVKPGGGRIVKCLKEHEAQLSEACKAKRKERMDHSACKGDIETLCKGMQPGGGAIAKCLKENREKVSEGCKTELKEHRQKRGKQGGEKAH